MIGDPEDGMMMIFFLNEGQTMAAYNTASK
jgi:hypothetical protein